MPSARSAQIEIAEGNRMRRREATRETAAPAMTAARPSRFIGRNDNVRSYGGRGRAPFNSSDICRSSEQRVLVESCRALIDGDVPGYVPIVRGGGRMHVRMLCLGRHWNGKTLPVRGGAQRLTIARTVPPLPEPFRDLARGIAHRRRCRSMPTLHSQLLRSRGPHGAASGQGRKRAVARPLACRSSRFLSVTPRAFFSADCGGAIRSRRCCSNPATRLCSAARRGSATTACRASSRSTAPPELGLEGRFNLTFRRMT